MFRNHPCLRRRRLASPLCVASCRTARRTAPQSAARARVAADARRARRATTEEELAAAIAEFEASLEQQTGTITLPDASMSR